MKKLNKTKDYRRCLSCKKIDHKSNFLRVVRNHPQHNITLDQGEGRSAYICPNSECLSQAVKKRLHRALKAPIPEEIYQQLWQKLKERKNTVK